MGNEKYLKNQICVCFRAWELVPLCINSWAFLLLNMGHYYSEMYSDDRSGKEKKEDLDKSKRMDKAKKKLMKFLDLKDEKELYQFFKKI